MNPESGSVCEYWIYEADVSAVLLRRNVRSFFDAEKNGIQENRPGEE